MAPHVVPNHNAMQLKTLGSQSEKTAPQESMVKIDADLALEVDVHEVNPVNLPVEQAQFHHSPMTRALLS